MAQVIFCRALYAGEYSAERMRELKASAQLYTGPRAPMSSVTPQPEESNGGGFKLSGSFKPATAKKPDSTPETPAKQACSPH